MISEKREFLRSEEWSMSKERYAELDTLSANERKIVAGGLEALRSLARTFDVWMVVGEGIKVLRAKADRLGGTKAFRRLLVQNGYDSLDNSVISKLVKIIGPSPRGRGLARNSLRQAAARVVGSKHDLPALPDVRTRKAGDARSDEKPRSTQRKIDH